MELENKIKMIFESYKDKKVINKVDIVNRPNKNEIIGIVEKLFRIIYPGYFYSLCDEKDMDYKINIDIQEVIYLLKREVYNSYRYCNVCDDLKDDELRKEVNIKVSKFIEHIPMIREYLETDVMATFDGDPAAKNYAEIIYAYPGIFAITIYRISHDLYKAKIPMIPRILSEYAHSITGIDINPGAVIGKRFFIDHGTGIVIGETTQIGDNVKIYQGVTLGALTTAGGQNLKGVKRHPTIGNNVVIYSNASILGGNTIIPDGVTVNGNSFITKSIEK